VLGGGGVGVDWALLGFVAEGGAGDARGLQLLLLDLALFFFWNSACIFHNPFSSLLSSLALLVAPPCLGTTCLLCKSLILLVMLANPARPKDGAGEES